MAKKGLLACFPSALNWLIWSLLVRAPWPCFSGDSGPNTILLDILYLIGKILRLCSAKTFEVLERQVAWSGVSGSRIVSAIWDLKFSFEWQCKVFRPSFSETTLIWQKAWIARIEEGWSIRPKSWLTTEQKHFIIYACFFRKPRRLKNVRFSNWWVI